MSGDVAPVSPDVESQAVVNDESAGVGDTLDGGGAIDTGAAAHQSLEQTPSPPSPAANPHPVVSLIRKHPGAFCTVLASVVFLYIFVVGLFAGHGGTGGLGSNPLSNDHGTGVTADPLAYGEVVGVPWEAMGSGGGGKGKGIAPIHLAFLYCWHVGGEKAAYDWFAAQQALEDETGGARPLNSKLRQYRDHRCVGADEMGAAFGPTTVLWSPRQPPLWERLLADDNADELPTAREQHAWTAVVEDYVQTARTLGGRAILESLNPRVTRVFFHPATIHTNGGGGLVDDDDDEDGEGGNDADLHATWTSLPGRLFYRVILYDARGRIRPRMVDHFALVALLNGWANTWMARLDKYLGAAATAQDPRCICPAHLGILGSGMHFSYGPDGMTPSKEAAADSWRILLDVQLVKPGEVGFQPHAWAPSPMPKFHAFPALLDDVFLSTLDNATVQESLPDTSLFRYYEMMPALRDKLADKVAAADSGSGKLVRRLREQMQTSSSTQRLDWITSMSKAQVAMDSLDAMTARVFPGNQIAMVPSTAETIVLKAIDYAFKRAGDATADDTRCFLYCQHLEEWLLHGLPEEEEDAGGEATPQQPEL